MAAINRAITDGSDRNSSVRALAGGDMVGRQVTVQTGGLVAMHADGDIDLQAGRTTSETDSATQSTQRKLLGGKTTATIAQTRYESLIQGSRIEGNLVSITASGAINSADQQPGRHPRGAARLGQQGQPAWSAHCHCDGRRPERIELRTHGPAHGGSG